MRYLNYCFSFFFFYLICFFNLFTYFYTKLFLALLAQEVQRRLVSELNGQKFRLLIVKWRKVILPALSRYSEAKRTQLKQLFAEMEEVSIFIHFVYLLYI